MAELFANGAQTTLAAPVTAVATTISVTSAGAFPVAAGQFRILIDSELMLVTAGGGTTTWTVTRAVEPFGGVTAASTHSTGATVAQVVTAAALASAAGSGSYPIIRAGGGVGATSPMGLFGTKMSGPGAPVGTAGQQNGDIASDSVGNLFSWSGSAWVPTGNLNLLATYAGIAGAGAPPAASGRFLIQAGSYVVTVTNTSGGCNMPFATAFPNGLISVVIMIGDNTAGDLIATTVFGNCSVGSWGGTLYHANNNTPLPNGTTARLNYIAIGW